MNSPLINRKWINALFLIRDALVLISRLEGYDYLRPDAKGDLTLMILKRKYPKKNYGPYKYPNVSLFTWEEMERAKGMNGSETINAFVGVLLKQQE